MQKRTHRSNQLGTDAEALHENGPGQGSHHENRREHKRKEKSVDQGMTRVFEIFPAIGLRNEGIETEQQPSTKNCNAVVETLSESRSSDGDRTVGQAAYHNGVHDSHAHPTDLGKNKGKRKAERGSALLA